jgi:hypothetical protein
MTFQDGWPDASEFPYPALIRIRYAHELDLEVLRIVQHAVIRTLPDKLATELAKTITSAAARVARAGANNPVPIGKSASRANFTAFLSILSDDDLCPTWPWPGPPPWWMLGSISAQWRVADPSPVPWRVANPDPVPWRAANPQPNPWHAANPEPNPWHGISLVAGVHVLTSARQGLGALVDRAAAEHVDTALSTALDQLAG